ncbi:MAG: DUF488 domain-containing protein [Phycisphaerae bacterium]|nr:DUF488 domain-containing protein [Phycisphaerae bacterium]
MPDGGITVYTIGSARKNAETFFGKLEQAGVRCIIDIRLRNTSHLAGFTKRDDLRFLLRRVVGIEYVHVPELAPTDDLLDDYLKRRIDWSTYERRFNKILVARSIETLVTPERLADACLLCSEVSPKKCHRRLVAEYLQRRFGNIRILHLA